MSILESRRANRPDIRKAVRHIEYYGLEQVFDKLYSESCSGAVFSDLMGLISSDDNIRLAYRSIKSNKGSHTPGVDNRTIEDVEKMSEAEYLQRVRRKLAWYQPRPVKRVEIPKPDGRTRPLGIPCIMDRIVQQCILQVLQPICEAKFHKSSHGFRPNRSTETAIAQCYRLIQKEHYYHVVDIDIKGFFDNVDHHKLMSQLWTLGIRDKRLICIIKAILKAPIVHPDGAKEFPQKGTPQGGILSPLLANINLNEFDWWIARQWKDMELQETLPVKVMKNGAIHPATRYYRMRKTELKEVASVRYADDFKVFCKTHGEAMRMYHATTQWLKERLKLDISPEKSRVVDLKESYSDYLGFKLKVRPKGKSFVVLSHISDKALKREQESMINLLKVMAHPKGEKDGSKLVLLWNARVLGIHQYYSLATCIGDDLSVLGWTVCQNLKHGALKDNIAEDEKTIRTKFIKERFGEKTRIPKLYGIPMYPIQCCRHRHPMEMKNGICNYTPEGRALIHKSLGVDLSVLRYLMLSVDEKHSIRFIDNRVSKYCAQYGRCAILKEALTEENLDCHHVTPVEKGGTDEYKNLVIIHRDMHRLIHAEDETVIQALLSEYDLKDSELEKVNHYRGIAGQSKIRTDEVGM